MATVQVGSMTPWKQNTMGDVYHVYKPKASPKPRPAASSPRYVRTWSQEEESYLLEARRARVPYKDIATRLNKTDLACRLHYHQMVVARKNASPDDSNRSPPPEPFPSPLQYQHRAESLPPISTALSPQTMLLPAPVMRDPSRNGSGAMTMSPPIHRRAQSHPHTPGRMMSPTPPIGGIQKRHSIDSQRSGGVDLGRIQELYRDFAPGFWSNIAAAYSHDRQLSPSQIENAFWAGQNMSRPSSPASARSSSPSSWPSAVSTSSTMTSQTSMDEPFFSPPTSQSSDAKKMKCSVNSLLNN